MDVLAGRRATSLGDSGVGKGYSKREVGSSGVPRMADGE